MCINSKIVFTIVKLFLHHLLQRKEEIKMSFEEAIHIVQIHERARQGRLRAKFMKEIKMQELQDKNQRRTGAPTLDHDVAAVRIQKVKLLLDVDINLVL
jgi:hypothetical protein